MMEVGARLPVAAAAELATYSNPVGNTSVTLTSKASAALSAVWATVIVKGIGVP